MTNNLRKVKKDLCSFAKRCQEFRYTDSALITFLITGTVNISNNLFSAESNTTIEKQKQVISTSIKDIHQKVQETRKENDKLLKKTNLELIQLMEQGDHVVKSPWSSWQFGTNGFFNKWGGTYKGRGDKAEKYSYEGIFERSSNIYERSTSPLSENYALVGKSGKLAHASGGANRYGLTSTTLATEPLISFEVSAGINPRSINKSTITISEKTAITPTLPSTISFTPPKPLITLPVLPELPTPPSFNIKLGSFCNSMSGHGCRNGDVQNNPVNGGQYGYGTSKAIGTPRSLLIGGIFIGYVNNVTLNTNDPSLTHGWANNTGGNSALFYAYFDATDGNKGPNSSVILNGNLTVTSINPVQNDTSLSSYNRQKFLVGGSRIGTLDNARDATLRNNATINLVGPLTTGFEVQSDKRFAANAGARILENAGIITDEAEKTNTELDGILAKGSAPMMLDLAPGLGGPAQIKVSRTSEGYTGYKVGLIMTFEEIDTFPNSNYILKNTNKISFGGEKSIGIQIFAPTSPSRVEVSNTATGNITLGGIESYGMKWSTRVANNSTMDNSGTIEISGDAGTEILPDGTTKVINSLSSGLAVIEDSSSGSGTSAIRAYQGKVTNSGIVNVSGGKGNTGMVLVVDAPDDITNTANGTINVKSTAGKQNIAMRVDKGNVATDISGTPKAINDGNIYLDGDSSIGMVGTNADVENKLNKKIVTKAGSTIINGIGMVTRGGNLENAGEIDLEGTGTSTNIGIYMAKGINSPTGTFAATSKVTVKGDDSTGVLVSNGALNYGGNITVEGNGVSGLIVGDNDSSVTNATITNNGTITVNNGATTAAGIYEYTNGTNRIKKGSYGIVVGKNSKFVSDGTHDADVNINVKGTESIGLYAGENAELEVKNYTINADDGAVNYDADKNSILKLKGTGTAYTGKKSLLFYLGEDGTGKVSIGNTMNATIEGGTSPADRGTAFYYVGNGSSVGITDIQNWAKNNFGDGVNSTLSNLNLTMNPGSRLFIAQNTGMNLSDTTGTAISSATGANITGTGYKTFMLYLSKLTINQDVNLNNIADTYNQLEIVNSSIANANNKTMTGTQINDIAMAQENDKTLYPRNKVTLGNEGKINLSGTNSTGMYAKYGELYNRGTGVITMSDTSTAMYGIDDSILENAGEITIGKNTIAMYSEGSTTQGMKNTGTIKLPQTDSVAMSYNPDSALAAGVVVENTGNIELSGDKNTAIYSTGTPVYKVKNSGTVILSDSATINNPNVALYTNNSNVTSKNTGIIVAGNNTIGIYGYETENNGDIKVGNSGIGIYSKNGNVTLTGGKIKTGTGEAVGVYTVGSGQNITNTGTEFEMGDNSFGFVNVGNNNTITSSFANIGLNNKNVYVYSNDVNSSVINSSNIISTGKENYGIYSAGTVENYGTIDLSSGEGSVAIYSIKGGTATNHTSGIINVGASNVTNSKYSIGMGAGYTTVDTGNIINKGTINVNGKSGFGMYATGSGSTARNEGNITLNADNTTGIYVTDGAVAINTGTITTGAGNYRNVVGVYLGEGSTLNNTGIININAKNAKGVYLKGGTIINYGSITVNGETDRYRTVIPFTTPDTGKELGGVVIKAPVGASTATITVNGVPQTPVVINTKARNPISVSASSVGMYVNTSGINFTNAINGLGNLTNEADLIVGTEATEVTNEKYILINDPRILGTYMNAMASAPNIKWNIYSSSLTWMATPTLELGTNRITGLYMTKVPYTTWAGADETPVDKTDTYNFADGLEQRYGVEALGSRENQLFQKLNSIGNNEEVLLYQAFDEMMGHQYANVQQRINETGNMLDKEFKYLKNEWRNPTKDNNKIKVFGMKNEYKTDTAGIIDYTSDAYGVAYVHENETIKLGNSSGWYAGAVTNRFKFKDIGKSKENQTMLKAGIFKTMSPMTDHNGLLRWTVAGDVFVGRNEMKRKFLVVDEVFNAKSDYTSYGAAFKTDLGYDIRMSERTHLKPYGALKMEYGRFNNIKEDDGEVRLEVKGNDYFSVKPEVGLEFKYVQPMAVKTNLSVGLTAAYENELGKVGDVNNEARVRYTNADWFGIRGEKEDRRGNGKFDLNIGVDNTRFGVTVNAGYDTKGSNVRGGIGFRAIY